MIECLECNAEVAVPAEAAVGDVIVCRVCGESFEVVGLDPVEIDYPEGEDAAAWGTDWEGLDDEEDWDDEDEEDGPEEVVPPA